MTLLLLSFPEGEHGRCHLANPKRHVVAVIVPDYDPPLVEDVNLDVEVF